MGSVKKSSFVIIWHFCGLVKTWGGISDKNFCDETKILSGLWIGSRDGITGDWPEIADFNCIDNLERW